MDAKDVKLLIAALAAAAGNAFIQENVRLVDDPDRLAEEATASKEVEPGLEMFVTVGLREKA